MIYEQIVSSTFTGGLKRYSDILGLGDADIWQNETAGFATNANHYPMGVIIGLGACYKRVQKLVSNSEIHAAMNELYEQLRVANSYGDYCKLVETTDAVYEKYKIRDLIYKAK